MSFSTSHWERQGFKYGKRNENRAERKKRKTKKNREEKRKK
jgi:hypothetical protein